MSWRCDTRAVTPGRWLASKYPGLGILGADVPRSGDDGPSVLARQITSAQDAVEVRIVVDRSTLDAGVTTFNLGEDGSLTAGGTDGVHTVDGEVFFGHVSQGMVRFEFYVGDTALVLPENIWRVPAENRIWRAR